MIKLPPVKLQEDTDKAIDVVSEIISNCITPGTAIWEAFLDLDKGYTLETSMIKAAEFLGFLNYISNLIVAQIYQGSIDPVANFTAYNDAEFEALHNMDSKMFAMITKLSMVSFQLGAGIAVEDMSKQECPVCHSSLWKFLQEWIDKAKRVKPK